LPCEREIPLRLAAPAAGLPNTLLNDLVRRLHVRPLDTPSATYSKEIFMSDDSRDPARLADSAGAAGKNDLSGLPGAAARLAEEATDRLDAPAQAAGQAAGRAAGTAAGMVDHARDAVASAAERVRAAARERFDTEDPVGELRRVEQETEAYIRRNPLRSVAMAFAAGYLIAMIRRL
jgi:ElaB/YqjD/DUF883 family membrane-anchored ribosome-binding protein